jgi:hypothetical protein
MTSENDAKCPHCGSPRKGEYSWYFKCGTYDCASELEGPRYVQSWPCTQLASKQQEVERLARKVCLALVAFPESVQELITAATEYDDLVDSTPETDPSEIVAWDELCHEAYQFAEQILAALSPEASET